MDIKTLSIKLEPSTNRKVINGKYRIIKKIGQGQFGKVLLGEIVDGAGLSNGDDRSTKDAYGKTEPEDNLVAIKTINRIDKTRLITKAYLSQTTKIKREIKIMKECNHPNVVKLYQVIDDLKFDKILLILEYCKFGEVDWKRYSHYYEKYKNTDREALTMNKILRDVVNGLEYLHSIKKIIHRDLKPSNLLIAADNSIKISDFGVSLILENNADDEKELGKVMGTPAFYAPELCQFVHNRFSVINNEHHAQNMVKIDHRIDIWSLGVIMYCLIFNNLPFNGRNEFELFKHIVKEELTFPKIKVSSKVTDSDLAEMKLLKDLIRRMLSKDPETRISITEIKMHGFTTFDLDDKGKDEFWAVNSQFFKDKSKSDKAIKASQEKAEAEERRIQKAASDKAAEADLSSKIRRFFGKSRRPDKLVLTKETILLPPNPLKSPVKSINSIESPKDIHNLEPVDDLLDSYLDDSSSMGSIEGEFVDTSNILSGLEEEISTEKSLNLFADTPTTESIKIPIMKTNSQSLLMTGSSSAPTSGFSSIPPNKLVTPVASRFPLNIHVNSASSSSTNTSPMSMTINTYVSPQTPTNSHIVTVGDTSPSGSLKSIFSPTQRFFFRNKEKKPQEKAKATAKEKPTINSLSSPAKKVKKMDFEATRKKYTDLMEPPPIFGLNAAYPSKDNNNNNNNNSNNSRDSNSTGLGSLQASPISDTGTFGGGPSGGTALSSGTPSPATDRRVEFSSSGPSRTNSVISVGSGSGNTIGYGLSRITSSSSSLNLNAYLTDDNFSFVSTRSMKNGSKYSNDDTDDDFDFRAGNQEEEDEEDEGEADETLTVEDPADRPVPHGTYEVPANRFHSMSDFLDGLDT